MSVKTFQEFLKEKVGEREPTQERLLMREDWIGAVRRLMEKLRAWLRNADPDGLLEIYPETIARSEENLGTYEVDSLRIRLVDKEVKVLPVACQVVGYVYLQEEGSEVSIKAIGRVDVTNGLFKYILYRTGHNESDTWYALDPNHQAALLDQNRFVAILQDLLS